MPQMIMIEPPEKTYQKILFRNKTAVNTRFSLNSIKTAHLQSSVGSYPKMVQILYIKNGKSDTPLSCARKLLSLEFSDSADTFVERAIK